ncbi:5-formyltetrahydrofolate cyclo-ligase [Paenibacillus sp. CC-CFT747]|nr:5-formyltetrahydrofolate cyclo-ligase [Paenibacillus sp. CC-CFT747]
MRTGGGTAEESASSYPPVVFSYLSFGAEVDTYPLLEFCWRAGIPTAAPRTLSKTKEMKLHLISTREDVQQGIWGIPEPKPECPELPDTALIGWVVMPGLAFDPKGGRLGYGGGYYDRFLSEYARRHGSLPFLLALAFELQLVPEVPTEPHDIPVNAVVTESRWISAGEQPFCLGGMKANGVNFFMFCDTSITIRLHDTYKGGGCLAGD